MLSSTYQSTDHPLLSTLYEPLPKQLISVLEALRRPDRGRGDHRLLAYLRSHGTPTLF